MYDIQIPIRKIIELLSCFENGNNNKINTELFDQIVSLLKAISKLTKNQPNSFTQEVISQLGDIFHPLYDMALQLSSDKENEHNQLLALRYFAATAIIISETGFYHDYFLEYPSIVESICKFFLENRGKEMWTGLRLCISIFPYLPATELSDDSSEDSDDTHKELSFCEYVENFLKKELQSSLTDNVVMSYIDLLSLKIQQGYEDPEAICKQQIDFINSHSKILDKQWAIEKEIRAQSHMADLYYSLVEEEENSLAKTQLANQLSVIYSKILQLYYEKPNSTINDELKIVRYLSLSAKVRNSFNPKIWQNFKELQDRILNEENHTTIRAYLDYLEAAVLILYSFANNQSYQTRIINILEEAIHILELFLGHYGHIVSFNIHLSRLKGEFYKYLAELCSIISHLQHRSATIYQFAIESFQSMFAMEENVEGANEHTISASSLMQKSKRKALEVLLAPCYSALIQTSENYKTITKQALLFFNRIKSHTYYSRFLLSSIIEILTAANNAALHANNLNKTRSYSIKIISFLQPMAYDKKDYCSIFQFFSDIVHLYDNNSPDRNLYEFIAKSFDANSEEPLSTNNLAYILRVINQIKKLPEDRNENSYLKHCLVAIIQLWQAGIKDRSIDVLFSKNFIWQYTRDNLKYLQSIVDELTIAALKPSTKDNDEKISSLISATPDSPIHASLLKKRNLKENVGPHLKKAKSQSDNASLNVEESAEPERLVLAPMFGYVTLGEN